MTGNPNFSPLAQPSPAMAGGLPAPIPFTPASVGSGYSLVLAGYMGILSSIIVQILITYVGVKVPIVALAFVLVMAAYLLAGHHLRFAQSPLFFPWIALWVWWTLAGVLGAYPGRSVPYMITFGLRIHILPLLFCAIARTAPALGTVMKGFAAGYIVVLMMCFRYGETKENRFLIPDTTLANGNDLALHIVLGLCFTIAVLLRGRIFTKLIVFASIPAMVYYVFRTGSRANLLTLALLLVFSFFILPGRWKAVLAAGGTLMMVALLSLLPAGTMNRLFTFTQAMANSGDAREAELNRQAVDSTRARLQLQKRAIELTLEHPLFGVGPLMFEDAVDKYVRETEGYKSGWQASHNSYLQVSSESGLPGFLLYVWCIFACLRMNYQIGKQARLRGWEDEIAISYGLLLASLTYAFGILFCSIALDYYLAALVSFTAANGLAFSDKVRQWEQWQQRSAQQPVAAPQAPAFPVGMMQPAMAFPWNAPASAPAARPGPGLLGPGLIRGPRR